MPSPLITATPALASRREPAAPRGPVWGLRIEDGHVSLVLQDAELPAGGALRELDVRLPHVGLPFDFREGLGRFRHHRGAAQYLEIAAEARLLLDWLHQTSGGRVTGRAADDTLVLLGLTDKGARYTVRARLSPDPTAAREGDDQPSLTLSLYDIRVYGRVDEPWPVLAGYILDLLPAAIVAERTLTTARLQLLRPALAWTLSGLGWKLPELRGLVAEGVELRDGRLVARFQVPEPQAGGTLVTVEALADGGVRSAFERFIEDLELKRHHGQIDRLLEGGQVREALAEVYRAQDGPPRPGFLAERLIGICASRAILYDEGEKVCRGLLGATPGYAPALCGLASIAMGRGQLEEAALHLERLSATLTGLADREDATAADMTLAENLRAVDPAEARAALGRVLARSPDHEEALEALIKLAEDAGDEAAAMPLYKRLLFASRSPDRTREAGIRLARYALARKQPEEARVFLQVVLEAAPEDLEAQLALADVETDAGNHDEARRILEAALRKVPPTEGDRLVRVVARLSDLALGPLGAPRRARRVLWRAVDVPGLSEGAALELARRALDAGDPDLADRYSERVPKASDGWPDAAALRAESWLMRGEREHALAMLLEVLRREPAHAATLLLLERAAPDMASRERVLHPLRAAAERSGDPAERARLQRALARLYESLELEFDAIAPYEAVLRASPDAEDTPTVRRRLLDLYARHGMWPKHQALCERLLERTAEPTERLPLLVRLGRVALRELGRPDVARPALAEAVNLAPRRVEPLVLLRDALDALGEGEALVPILRRLESVHADERVRVGSRLRLAELQLDALGDPGQARATLERLPHSARRDPRARELRRRLGLEPAHDGYAEDDGEAEAGAEASDRAAAASAPARDPEPSASGAPSYSRALTLADEGATADARAELARLLAAEPLAVPAMELARMLALEAGDTAQALSLGDVLLELTVSRDARLALLDELLPVAREADPGRAERWEAVRLKLATPAQARQLVADGDRLEAALRALEDAAAAGDREAAAALVAEALALDADCVPALEAHAELMANAEEWEGLAEDLARLAELSFDARQTLAYTAERGHVLADRLGDLAGATAAWAQYAAWEPLDDAVFNRLVEALDRQGRGDELADLWARRGEAAADRADEARGAAEEAPFVRALVRARVEEARLRLMTLGDAAGALMAIDAAADRAGQEPEVLELQVRAAAASGDLGAARAALEVLAPMLLPGPLREELAGLVEGDG